MISSFINAGPDAAQRAALRGAGSVQPRATSATPVRRAAARTLQHWATALDPEAARAAVRGRSATPTAYRRAA
jgi:hypothetical protein